MGHLPRVAVLVDADNVRAGQIAFAVTRAGGLGRVVLKRAFGRLNSVSARADELSAHGFTAEVAFPGGSGKNAADLMLAQYAATLAERRSVEAVALVSSDGDFAPVATALAAAGIRTVAVGRPDASAALQDACAQFVAFPGSPPAVVDGLPVERSQTDVEKLSAILHEATASEKAHLATVGNILRSAFGGGYARRFGAATLSELIERLDGYELQAEGTVRWVVRCAAPQVVSLQARPAASG